MTPVVLDTNVLLVANGQHADISPECVTVCAQRLQQLTVDGVLVVDDRYRIVGEYQNKTQPNKGKGPGDAFLKWALRNLANEARCCQVAITETAPEMFAEFPDAALQPSFDAPDRKFAAAANAHPQKPKILQAADCKWLNWRDTLAVAGVVVDFVCPVDVRRFYAKKFPGQPIPDP
jgi:hypothetical protein